MEWEPKTNWKPMYRQNEVDSDDHENSTQLMVEVGRYEITNGIKSYSSDVEYQDTNNEELYYLDDDGNYQKVE